MNLWLTAKGGTEPSWRCIAIAAALATIIVAPFSSAQVQRVPPEEASPSPLVVDPPAARTPETGAGRIGQRQSRGEAAREAGIEPMARINNRIANRVQSRIRNRIGPSYNPRANATSPFEVASDQVRSKRQRR